MLGKEAVEHHRCSPFGKIRSDGDIELLEGFDLLFGRRTLTPHCISLYELEGIVAIILDPSIRLLERIKHGIAATKYTVGVSSSGVEAYYEVAKGICSDVNCFS